MRKAEIVNQAYSQLRISGLTTLPAPEEITLALQELDWLMWRWAADGRDVGYHFPAPTTGDELVISDANEDAGVYSWAIPGIAACLARNIAVHFDKPIPPTLEAKCRSGLNTIRQRTIRIDPQQYPNRMPRGSGNELWQFGRSSRFYHPSYRGRGDQTTIKVNQNLDMTCDFSKDLAEGDSIESYTIAVDAGGGLILQSDSRDGNVVYYRVLAQQDRDGKVTITATTANGLVIPKAYCFDTAENTCVVTQE